jgi:uncharacterized protein involved in outer membrane biogenesis
LLFLVALGFAASMFLDRGARIAVEKGVSYALDVPTSAGSVSIHPFSGSVGLNDLSISNPAGFSAKPLLALKEATMGVQMSSLMSDVVEVSSLELSGIQLRLEGRGMKTNYAVILDSLARFDSADKQNGKPAKEAQGSQKRFLIHDLVIRNASFEVDYALDSPLVKVGNTGAALTLPEIRLKDIGNGKSLSLAELSMLIFKALLQAASSGNIPGLSAEVAKDLGKNLSGLAERAGELGKDVEGALKGLLKKKN